ncbi:hypothetical protein B0I35DRAFT_78028 [Stachybotrys elegans]|uniref:Uncharacterized protein n=1 Tax=Stachybotrys elegans TaxID=80388 RepID=A0A8K0SFB6_9HYPO|nr:hypothetical protein B0I35DRAFT_78028 [Stachybotrys elegans]
MYAIISGLLPITSCLSLFIIKGLLEVAGIPIGHTNKKIPHLYCIRGQEGSHRISLLALSYGALGQKGIFPFSMVSVRASGHLSAPPSQEQNPMNGSRSTSVHRSLQRSAAALGGEATPWPY